MRTIFGSVNWLIVAAFLVVLGLCVYALIAQPDRWQKPATIIFLLVGWVFSLCMHEWAHAATAVLGGDNSSSTASYLSFNPLRYLHPVMSIIIPVIILLIGGIPIPGGAVYLRRDLVRSRGWQSAISAAGPLMNILWAIALAIPFQLGVADQHPALAAALAALGFLEVAMTILNLLPIPGLDGFGIIAPWLSREAQAAVRPFYNYGVLILFFLLIAVRSLDTLYGNAVLGILSHVRMDAVCNGVNGLDYCFNYGLNTLNFLRIGGGQ
jgi:Zn-dependent protease